jgi:polyhydroxyalkanoate synthesis repressor PhaR
MKLIKKYKNRRIYDTDKSKYITFDDIKQYIHDDVDFKVIDSSTEKDITSATLLQVIVEQETHQSEFLSNQILKQMIKMADSPMHGLMTKAFEQTFDFINNQSQGADYLENYKKMTDTWTNQMQSLMSEWFDDKSK